MELRPGIGVNIFGCDVCQDVCPWNSKSRFQVSGDRFQGRGFEPKMISFQPPTLRHQRPEVGNQQLAVGMRPIQNPKSKIENPPGPQDPAPSTISLFNPPLDVLAGMTEEDFRYAFRHSPIRRAKYRGWLRNLCVAMANSGDARFISKLQELASRSDALVREHAEWALERLGSSLAEP